MNGKKFNRVLSQWTAEDVEMLHQVRYHRMTVGPGNICQPDGKEIDWYHPFNRANYQWQHKLGSFSSPPWLFLKGLRPEAILSGDPWAPSQSRQGGWRVWDGAAAVPRCTLRGDRVKRYQDIVPVRNCNTSWLEQMEPAMRRTGPLGFGGEVLRPSGDFILDLTTNELGWQILEAAHALAHLRGDVRVRSFSKQRAASTGRTSGNFAGAVGEIVFSILYDLPMDVTARENNDPGSPDAQYGIEIKTSTSFLDPLMKIPWNSRESPQPDKTLAVVQMAVYIEPHPKSYETQTDTIEPGDNWRCMPTIVAVAGWECMDVIAHQPLTADQLDAKRNDAHLSYLYTMKAADLMEPGLLWGYLKGGVAAQGPPVVNERYQYFEQWIQSDAYKQLIANTPPLVCSECMTFVKSDKAPRHAYLNIKPGHPEYELNEQRKANVARVHGLVDKAISQYEKKYVYHAPLSTARIRRRRKAAHAKLVAQRLRIDRWLKLKWREINGGRVVPGTDRRIEAPVSGAVEKMRLDLKKEIGEDRLNACLQHALDTGLFNL